MAHKRNNINRWLAFGWLIAIGLYALRPIEAYDTFWQLQAGKYIWQKGEFIYSDTFSLAVDAYRMEHCWLHDIFLYISYVMGGYTLLSFSKPVTVLVCAALLLKWSLRQNIKVVYSLPVLTLCVIASEPSWLIRPQLWTFIFSILYLLIFFRGRDAGLRMWGWLVPIMLLWANLHAACIFGLVMIGLFWTGEFIRFLQKKVEWQPVVTLGLVGLASFGVAFINPYGYRIPLSLLLANIKQHAVITGEAPVGLLGNMEWLPSTFAQVPLFYIIMILWGCLILLRIRKLDPVEGVFFLALLYMGVSQIRHTTLVALVAGPFLPQAVQDIGENICERWPSFKKCLAPLPYATLGVLLVLTFGVVSGGKMGWGLKEYEYPVASADFVLENKLPPQIYNSYDWGGYLMWRLYPQHLVFVDGRSSSVEHFRASSQIDDQWDGWSEALDNYGINTIITRTCYYDTGEPMALIDGLVTNREWKLVFSDETSLIYLRDVPEYKKLIDVFSRPSSDAYRTQLAEAERLYSGAPGSRPKALLAIGRASVKVANWQKAHDAYTEYLRRHPGHSESMNALRFLERLIAS